MHPYNMSYHTAEDTYVHDKNPLDFAITKQTWLDAQHA